jgi:hypothetical protein
VVSAGVLTSAPGARGGHQTRQPFHACARGRSQSIQLYQVSEAAGAATPNTKRQTPSPSYLGGSLLLRG